MVTNRRIEFKVSLDQQQQQIFDHHIAKLQAVWNIGLACIEWREWWEKWQQVLESPDHPDYAPDAVPMGWGHNSIKGKKKPVYGLCCDRVKFRLEKNDPILDVGEWVEGTKKGSGDSIAGYWVAYPAKPDPVKEHWVEDPRLPKHGQDPYMSLVSMFGKKYWPSDHFIQGLSSAWIKGQCKNLATAWKAYKKGIRKRPQFKKRHEAGNSLLCVTRIPLKQNGMTLPGMGFVRIPKLAQRWDSIKDPCPISLLREGSRYYVQLTATLEQRPVRSNGVTVGIDPGLVHVATDDRGRMIDSPRYAKKQERRKRRLQRSMARKFRLNTTTVYDEDGRVLRHEPRKGWKRRNHAKVKQQLQSLEAHTKRARRAFNHFHSTRIVQSADVIVLENLQLQNIGAKVKTGKTGISNGRKRKTGLNNKLRDNAIGQLFAMVEQKAAAAGKLTTRVNPFRTSMTCNRCGFSDKANRVSQAVFHCQSCGHRANADQNAAANIRKMGLLGVTKLTFDNDWRITVPNWHD